MQLKLKTFTICMLFIVTYSFAQTGIGTSTPHASAKLHVSATDKGFLPPRVTLTSATDATTIPSPAEGLLVYNLGSVGLQAGYYYWNGSNWATIATGTTAGNAVIASDLVKLYGEVYSTASGKIANVSGYSFTVPISGRYLFDFSSSGYINQASFTFTFAVRQGTTVLASDFQTSANNNIHVEYNGKLEVNLQSGITYNVYVNSTGSRDSGDFDRVYYKMIAGNLPVNQHMAERNIQLNNNFLSNDGDNEGIRVDNSGNVGIGTSAPQSTLDISGSQAQNYTATSLASYTVLPTDNVIDLTLSGTQTVTNFTASTSNLNRILTIVNNTSATTKTISSYVNNLGTSVTSIPANSTLIIQSTGTTWKQINGVAGSSNTVITTTNGNGSAGQLLSSNGNGTYTWVSGPMSLRVLSNAGGTFYTQSQLQTLYNNTTGLNAPDTVPIEVVNAANALNNSNYKVYLGHNKWWYTNIRIGTTSSWIAFGGGTGKSDFSANIDASGLFTYK